MRRTITEYYPAACPQPSHLGMTNRTENGAPGPHDRIIQERSPNEPTRQSSIEESVQEERSPGPHRGGLKWNISPCAYVKRLHVNHTFEEVKNLEVRKPVRVSTSGSRGIREFKTATNPENRECLTRPHTRTAG